MTSFNPIDFITQTSDTMIQFFNELKTQQSPSAEDMAKLNTFYESVMNAIGTYYVYLKETGVPVTESYLTHWLEEGSYHEKYDEIETFLNPVYDETGWGIS